MAGAGPALEITGARLQRQPRNRTQSRRASCTEQRADRHAYPFGMPTKLMPRVSHSLVLSW